MPRFYDLTDDLDFGSDYGLQSVYYKSQATNIARVGVVRLARTESIAWRNNANTGDLELSVNASDALLFNGAAPGGMTNPMTTSGDIIYGGTAGAATRLAKGSDTQILTLAAGVPSWAANAAMTNPMSASGDIIYGGTAGAATRLAKGSDGQYLKLASGLPSWATLSGGDVVGPASSTDNSLARFDSTTGKLLQNSIGILSDTGSLSGLTDITLDNGGTDGGAWYFNGGATSYLKSTADGLSLNYGGFTKHLYPNDTMLATDAADSYNGLSLQLTTSGLWIRRGFLGAPIKIDFTAGAGKIISDDGATYSYKRLKVTKAYTHFSDAGSTKQVSIFTLPVGAVIRDVYAVIGTTFLGGTIGTYTISVGLAASSVKYMAANDVKTSAVNLFGAANKGTALTTPGLTNIESMVATTAIVAEAISTVDTLNHATQGSIDFYIEYSDLE